MSTFISHLKGDLPSKIRPKNSSPDVGFADWETQTKQVLRSYFLGLQPPESLPDITNGLSVLRDMDSRRAFAGTGGQDTETEGLRAAILAKLVLGLYIQCLNMFLDQASQAEAELEWWGDIERSRLKVTYYLLQSFPSRLANLAKTVVHRVHSEGISLSPSTFTPSSLRHLFPSNNVLRPNALTVALYPHLRYEPYSITLSALQPRTRSSSRSSNLEELASAVQGVSGTLRGIIHALWSVFTFPVGLAKNECQFKKRELAKIRDARATTLGGLYELRSQLENALEAESSEEVLERLSKFCCVDICRALQNEPYYPITIRFKGDTVECLDALSSKLLPEHLSNHRAYIGERALGRPSRLILLWPKLVFLPPLILYGIRAAYNSKDSLEKTAHDAWETVQSFWSDWLVGPVKDMINTVRTGGDQNIIITKESVKANLDSLERMTLSLAKDTLNYTPEQMEALSQQIRVGDLTMVMQIYEEDIRKPLKSAVAGTLLRTLLVQVQKAKVDIDQTLTGIDKLLKSQELTFGFVGVSPAIALVYGFISSLRTLWTGSRGKGRYGGKQKRAGAWVAMRRIERLLIEETKHHEPSAAESKLITPQTSGLLLLSTTHLRAYAERNLPAESRLREGFLEDVADLEDPGLGRDEKLRILDRMWNSWGAVLGWHKVAAH